MHRNDLTPPHSGEEGWTRGMPPITRDQCAEHGLKIAVLENEQKHIQEHTADMENRLGKVEKQVDRFLGGYAVVLFLLALAGTIAGNVVSAKMTAPTVQAAHQQAQADAPTQRTSR